ncbi:MAG: isopentenyl phosphate kinase [Desulfurococcaceae archaeon]
MRTIFLKLGGSFITYKDKPITVNYNALTSTIDILKQVIDSDIKIIIGNGGGSFAHFTVMRYFSEKKRSLIVKCHQSTRLLNRIIVDYIVNNGIPATSVQTSAIISYYDQLKLFKVFYEPIVMLIENGVIPVVYGECLPTREEPIVISTEKVFELLAQWIKPDRIILLTDVKGVYTCDPRKCTNPTLIQKITPDNLDEVLRLIRDQEKTDVTGGIYGKVLSMSKLSADLKTEIFIMSGFDTFAVIEAIKGGYPGNATLVTYK